MAYLDQRHLAAPDGDAPAASAKAVSAPKWTPGPWRVELATEGFRRPCEYEAKDFCIVSPDRGCPAIVWEWYGHGSANAHLIAAAPELYEALAGLVEDITNSEHTPHDWSEQVCVRNALAALKRARCE